MRCLLSLLAVFLASHGVNAASTSFGDQNTINNALSAGGQGHLVQLCADVTIKITGTIQFTANNQDISTQGYPTGITRATVNPNFYWQQFYSYFRRRL